MSINREATAQFRPKSMKQKNSTGVLSTSFAKTSAAASSKTKPLKKVMAKKAVPVVTKCQKGQELEHVSVVRDIFTKNVAEEKNKQQMLPHKSNKHQCFQEAETREDSTLLGMTSVDTCFD